LNSDAAKEIYKQISELELKLDQTLRDLPEVKDKLAEIQQVEKEMLVELQVRTALIGMIAAREKDGASVSPE
jgi:regulator of replication initiation timing